MFENIKAVLFDLDGTIYYGSQLIDGADKVVEMFRKQGKEVYFMTNNSTKTRKQIHEKLVGMGLPCSVDEVYTSGYAASLYIKEQGYESVYVFGTKSLEEELKDMDIQISDKAQVVIVGYDMEFDYGKLTDALQVALQAKVIIACNNEKHYPGENAKRMPGCGAMVGALEGSLGRKVDYVVGKPNPMLLDIICKQRNLKKDEILVVGDTYESDIEMSQKYGCDSVYIGDANSQYMQEDEQNHVIMIGEQVVETTTRRVSPIKEMLDWM